MINKPLVCPERVRQLPRGFGWVDHQFMRAGFVSQCAPMDLALYLVLVSVSDEVGLSYYSEQRLAQVLRCSTQALVLARQRLIERSLIAYQYPLYQVLSLSPKDALANGQEQLLKIKQQLHKVTS